jgi:ubiquinone/menaquinone biosynthesis C-methylase UbiE
MKIPNFRTRKGSELYTMTAGHRIAPLVADLLAARVAAAVKASDAQARLLDIACGPGTLTLRLARELLSTNIIGVDASQEMIAHARTRATEAGLENRVTFAAMDAHHLAFETASVDVATCNLGFPFFAHPVGALAEIGRVLTPGACFWASVPNRQSWHELFSVVHDALPVLDRLLRGFMAKLEQAEKLLPTLEQAGFDVTQRELVRLPFTFADGHEAVAFFNDLFSLFTTLPGPVERHLSGVLDERFPHGVTTAYVALLACARWDASATSPRHASAESSLS